MVCIIDDREDVWKFAPNLITVKKYVYFPGTGDVNAPPGARESQTRKKGGCSSSQCEISILINVYLLLFISIKTYTFSIYFILFLLFICISIFLWQLDLCNEKWDI